MKIQSLSKVKLDDSRHSKLILITGGAGYLGSVLTRRLLEENYKVRVLDKLIYENECTLYDLLENKNFSFINGDFGSEKVLENALNNVTDVVHLAALVGDPVCKKYPELALKTNLEDPKKLFQAINGKGIKKFIFTSTCSNYGLRKDDTPATEESELNPVSLYAETKVNFEKYILENLKNVDFSSTILRLSTAFGMSRRMRFDLTISEFTRELAMGEKLLVYDENTWRPYCNVADISDVILKVIISPVKIVNGQIFNVGGDQNNHTKSMIVELIKKYIRDTRIEYKTLGTDPRNYRVSFNKIRELLEFEPSYTVEASIRALITSVQNGLFTDIETRKNFFGNYYIEQEAGRGVHEWQ